MRAVIANILFMMKIPRHCEKAKPTKQSNTQNAQGKVASNMAIQNPLLDHGTYVRDDKTGVIANTVRQSNTQNALEKVASNMAIQNPLLDHVTYVRDDKTRVIANAVKQSNKQNTRGKVASNTIQ